jgi:Holliday junction DNA helicase RuvA
MYAYVKGILESIGSDNVIIETGGVGYKIYTPLSSISNLPRTGAEVKLYTRFIVREDSVMLCGFLTNDELSMFDMLLTVSGVGPKVAIAVLSAVSPAKFATAVMTEDHTILKSAQGVGAKLAQKICFELKDKIKKDQAAFAGVSYDSFTGGGGTEQSGAGKMREAISALTILGYSQFEANRIVSAVYSPELELEAIIKDALRQMGSKP